ncbi:beta-lactamase-like protein [Plectosphaerella cucumerina]|uniref:Beta-lactamase-like protein n=1 Tax=Plectosphaerella cucumerina TaxID=40658 RepID=A0A8K0TIG0_9PEZI|nr:beta-lactamase-like protein [Plectosphaerella cucumerina]
MRPVSSLIDIPLSLGTVSVSIVDTTFSMVNLSTSTSFGPEITGFETSSSGAWSFLIEHTDSRLVFDLGIPVRWETDFPPRISDQVRAITASGANVGATQYVSDILEDAGIALDTIDAVIWSHTHFDHIGRPSLFPSSTDLIVGEGTLEAFGYGYPDSPNSPYLARELANRTVTEIPFPSNTTRIGGLAAYEYFGDGSFYLLEAPGYEIGHINALARVTSSPPSFIHLGGDSFHHTSQLCPNRFVLLPKKIRLEQHLKSVPNPYTANLTSPRNTPFATVNQYENGGSLARYPEIARDVISKIHAFDADERVLVVGAHDDSLRGRIDLFPKKANHWRDKGWKKRTRWEFVADYEEALALLKV